MDNAELTQKIDAYLDENWEAMVGDIETLVSIPSFEELDKAEDGAPFGPGPKAALTAMLGIASDMGFETTDAQGYIGMADFPGKTDTQIGIIGHMDVVPAGPGWTFEPYALTRKDGYLLGRGTLDDKGPSVITLHAMKFWKDQGIDFPYTIRFLFGANEETNMGDVEYFHKHYEDPAFLFTPDAEFPVCYGEKGGFDAVIKSKAIPQAQRTIKEFEGGVATNAVPGFAHAVVTAGAQGLPEADRITVTDAGDGTVRIEASGKSAHASTPEEGINAIALVVDYLLANVALSDDEKAFFGLEQKLLNHTDGSGVGIDSEDEFFGKLTVVGGVIKIEDDCFVQSVDSRWPTSTSAEEMSAQLTKLAEEVGGSFENKLVMQPFLVKPDTAPIQALLKAYNDVTGEGAKPFTMGGATYAREFKSASSFGVEKPWEKDPEWVGSMHGPDEGISEAHLKEAFKIYVHALKNLQEIELS